MEPAYLLAYAAYHTDYTIRDAPSEGVAVIKVLREYLLKPKKACWVLSITILAKSDLNPCSKGLRGLFLKIVRVLSFSKFEGSVMKSMFLMVSWQQTKKTHSVFQDACRLVLIKKTPILFYRLQKCFLFLLSFFSLTLLTVVLTRVGIGKRLSGFMSLTKNLKLCK